MKTKFQFIFPRLIGATLVIGLASLIFMVVFKLMLGILLVGSMVMLLRSMIGRNRHEDADAYESHLIYPNVIPINQEIRTPYQRSEKPGHASKPVSIVPIH
jgi:hypothetical protein